MLFVRKTNYDASTPRFDSHLVSCMHCKQNDTKQKLDPYERDQRHDNPIDVSTSHSSKASRKRRRTADEDIQQTRKKNEELKAQLIKWDLLVFSESYC